MKLSKLLNYISEGLVYIYNSNWYYLVIICLLILTIFIGKIVSKFLTKSIMKDLQTKTKEGQELINESAKSKGFNRIVNNMNDYKAKAYTYFLVAFATFVQLLFLIDNLQLNRVDINVCFLVITVSILEYRDNNRAYTDSKRKYDIVITKLIDEKFEVDYMEIEDIVNGLR